MWEAEALMEKYARLAVQDLFVLKQYVYSDLPKSRSLKLTLFRRSKQKVALISAVASSFLQSL